MNRVWVGLVATAATVLGPQPAAAQAPVKVKVQVTCQLDLSRFRQDQNPKPQFSAAEVVELEKKLLEKVVATLGNEFPCWEWVAGDPVAAGYRFHVKIHQKDRHGSVSASIVVHECKAPADALPPPSCEDAELVVDNPAKKFEIKQLNDPALYKEIVTAVCGRFVVGKEPKREFTYKVPVARELKPLDPDGKKWRLPIKEAVLGSRANAALTFRVSYTFQDRGGEVTATCTMTFAEMSVDGDIVVKVVKGNPAANVKFVGIFLESWTTMPPSP